MTEYKEEDYLMLSGIQHFAFCRRQWALIHIEQQWAENFHTIDGQIMHEKVHNDGIKEKRKDVIITRGMHIFSKSMGISGNCDVVEFHKHKDGIELSGRLGKYLPVPIEYKRGKPKQDDIDEVQLCAQAMCLEEMLLCTIAYGYLYYGETKHRVKVEFTQEMRESVNKTYQEMHALFRRGCTPRVKTTKACTACSLAELCLPKLNKNLSVKEYIKQYIEEQDE